MSKHECFICGRKSKSMYVLRDHSHICELCAAIYFALVDSCDIDAQLVFKEVGA